MSVLPVRCRDSDRVFCLLHLPVAVSCGSTWLDWLGCVGSGRLPGGTGDVPGPADVRDGFLHGQQVPGGLGGWLRR